MSARLKLTEGDLDRHEAERLPVLRVVSAQAKPAPLQPIEPIPTAEREHPWLWALYALGMVAGAAASAVFPDRWF